MIFYVIKNYAKLMCRSSINVMLLVAAPIVLVAVLSSAFSSLMSSYEEAGEFIAGYRISDESIMTSYMDELKSSASENGVTLVEYPEGDISELISKEDLAGFVEFKGDTYTVVKTTSHETEGKILEYMMSSFGKNIETGMIALMSGSEVPEADLTVEHPDHMPAVDSTDYYGIVEIVYFLWCGIVCIAGIINNEKKYKIMQKLRVAGVSETKIYLSKFIPTVIVTAGGIGIAAVTSSLMFGIHWGNIPLSVLILLASVPAAIAMGLLFYSVSDNMVLTIVLTFGVVWFAGFVGGSFETYLFSSHPQFIKELSPIYYINRSLVELSSMGKTAYAGKAIFICIAMTVLCSAVSILAGTLRKRGRA